MKQFIFENWLYLVAGLLWLVNFLILLVKKNKVVLKDTIFEQLLLQLPQMILSVEEKGLSGSEKKALVMGYALSWLAKYTGEDSSVYAEKVSNAIEEILSTPKKKEVK